MNVSVVNVDVSEVRFGGSRLESDARDNRKPQTAIPDQIVEELVEDSLLGRRYTKAC